MNLPHELNHGEHEARVVELKRVFEELGLRRRDAWFEIAAAGTIALPDELIVRLAAYVAAPVPEDYNLDF